MKCENCGRQPLVNTDTVILPLDESGARIFCKQCYSLFGHCPMCQHSVSCAFANDPDPMPQFVTQTVRKQTPMGTQILQYQVMNPERVEKFCTSCKCYSSFQEEGYCCRQTNCVTCTNYCEVEQFKFVQDFSMEAVNEN